MKIRVYRNLHKKCWSVQRYIPKKGWRLYQHFDELSLKDAKFIIYQAGRLKVQRERRKNVHAFVEGELLDYIVDLGFLPSRIKYSPYSDVWGFTIDDRIVHEVKYITFNKAGCYLPDNGLGFLPEEGY